MTVRTTSPARIDIQAVYPQQRYLPAKVMHFVNYLRGFYNSPATGRALCETPRGCFQTSHNQLCTAISQAS